MSALSGPRKTEPVFFTIKAYKMKAGAVIYPGGLVGADASGWAIAATAADTVVILGLATGNPRNIWDNTLGGNGAMSVNVEGSICSQGRVAYWLDNAAGGDAVTQAHVGRKVYVKDDHTVTSTVTSANAAGKCLEVSSTKGVLVEFMSDSADDADDALAAAQDAQDDATQALADAATAQATAENAPSMQAVAAGAVVAGTVTINTGIVVAADSEVIPILTGAVTGSTNFGSFRELKSSRVNGIAGVGTVVIEAVGADGAKDVDAAAASGVVRVVILTPQ